MNIVNYKCNLNLLILLLSAYLVYTVDVKDANNLCKPAFCQTPTTISEYVLKYCNETDGVIQNRCCINGTNVNQTIALDYSNCNLKNLNEAISVIRNEANAAQSLHVFDVRNNQFKDECKREDFEGFTNLNEFYYPNNCFCPGNNYSWIHVTEDSCTGLKDLCASNYTNTNCTSTSYCVNNGPGNFLCNCKSGYHGYKCLTQGEFPTLTFTLTFCIVSVFLSACFWHFQRRFVLKQD